jgi:hypothetical protein
MGGMSAWSKVEKFLRSEGLAEGEVERILEIARAENLDPTKVVRVATQHDETEVATRH